MKFDKNMPVVYPFTAYYHGYMGDLSVNTDLKVNLYDYQTNKIVNVNSMVDLREVRQVSNDILFVGTIYINRKDNNLMPGDYRLLLTVQGTHTNYDLLYAPIEIEDHGSPFQVSYLNRKSLTEDEFRSYLKDVMDPGVKRGFHVTMGSDSNGFDISSGVALTSDGARIRMDDIARNAVHLNATGEYPRTDLICIYYNEHLQDATGNAAYPVFRVLEGVSVNGYLPPMIPDNYIPIAYVSIKPLTMIMNRDSIKISALRRTSTDRPFFSLPAIETGDGERSVFTFNTVYVPDSTEVFVDGVRQVMGEDYKELAIQSRFNAIEFIGEVPQEGQKVTLTGQNINSPYIDYDMTPYTTPANINEDVYPSVEEDIIAGYTGADYHYSEYVWANTTGPADFGFYTEAAYRPIKGHNRPLGSFAYMEDTSRFKLDSLSRIPQSNISIVMVMSLEDTPVIYDDVRLLTMDNIHVDVRVESENTLISMTINGEKSIVLTVSNEMVRAERSILTINIFDDELSLRYGISKIKKMDPSGVIELPVSESSLTLGRPLLEEEENIPGLTYNLSAFYLYTRKMEQEDILNFKK